MSFLLFCAFMFAQNKFLVENCFPISKVIIIDSDYNLNGDTLRFPQGSKLVFKGGKIDNGVIVGNNTHISVKQDNPVFGIDLIIEGRWSVKKVYDRWFEYKSDSTFVSNRIIRNILALSNDDTFCHIFFNEPRIYYYQLEYKGPPNIWDIVSFRTVNGKSERYWDEIYYEKYSSLRIFTIPSNTHLTINNTMKMLPTKAGAYYVFWEYGKENIVVDGYGTIYGDSRCHHYFFNKEGKHTYSGEWGYIFKCIKCRNFSFRDLTLSDAHGDALSFDSSRYIDEKDNRNSFGLKVENVKIKYARRNGMSIAAKNVRIRNCSFEGCGIDEIYGTAPRAAIDFEPDDLFLFPEIGNVNVVMKNCVFINNKHDVSSTNNNLPSYGRFATIIKDCKFTAPVRLNATYWIKFQNCTIPGFTNWINNISEETPFKYLLFEKCVIDSMPSIMKTESWHNSFVNCEVKNMKIH